MTDNGYSTNEYGSFDTGTYEFIIEKNGKEYRGEAMIRTVS